MISLLMAFGCQLRAQQSDGTKKINIGGYATDKTVVCNGEEVLVSGDRHRISITGYCFSITVYGSETVIEMDSVRLIAVHGNKNRIVYKKAKLFDTKLLRFGSMNRLTLRRQ